MFARSLLEAYIANNMEPDQTPPLGAVWSGFLVFAPTVKELWSVIIKYAADIISRQHFLDKNLLPILYTEEKTW